jgi:hypothetical protein
MANLPIGNPFEAYRFNRLQLLRYTKCPMGSGIDTWDMRCAPRPIYTASGRVANGHCSPGEPSRLTGNFRPTPVHDDSILASVKEPFEPDRDEVRLAGQKRTWSAFELI